MDIDRGVVVEEVLEWAVLHYGNRGMELFMTKNTNETQPDGKYRNDSSVLRNGFRCVAKNSYPCRDQKEILNEVEHL